MMVFSMSAKPLQSSKGHFPIQERGQYKPTAVTILKTGKIIINIAGLVSTVGMAEEKY